MNREKLLKRGELLGRMVAACVALAILSMLVPTSAHAAAADDESCKLPATFALRHSGFPLGESFAASTGEHRVKVLFVDFLDRPSTETTQEAFTRLWRPEAEEFVERQSRRRVDLVVEPYHEWLTIDAQFAASPRNPSAQAIALADANVDFDGVDAVWVVLERSAERLFGFAWTAPVEHPVILADEGGSTVSNGLVLGTSGLTQTTALDVADVYVAHEALHIFGLPDLVNITDEANQWGFVGNFDPMGNLGGFVDGKPGVFPNPLNGGELFAWQRWQLGWIDDDQVVCDDGSSATQATLTPAVTGGGVKAVVVPTGPTEALVVEARAQRRYDRDLEREGLLVYAIDSTIGNARGSIQVQNPVSGSWPSGRDLLQPGQSLSVGGLIIKAGQRIGDDFSVEVISVSCHGEAVTIDMSAGASGIGTEGADVILGTAGDDVIDGRGGDDIICAEAGNDVVAGGDGDDVVHGGDGADVIRGNTGNDELRGDTGGDRIFGGTGDDVVIGGGGSDYLSGFGGADEISGGSGHDTIFGGFGADLIDGGPGNDRIRGLIGDDEIYGGNGDDEIDGDRGNDFIDGEDGSDLLRGGNANDTVRGGAGDDDVSGGKGDDWLVGGVGVDSCSGNLQLVADVAGNDCEKTFGVP